MKNINPLRLGAVILFAIILSGLILKNLIHNNYTVSASEAILLANSNSLTTYSELKKIMEKPSNYDVIVDLRPKREYLASHLPNSINIPAETLLKNKLLLKNKSKILHLYSNNEYETAQISFLLNQMGYKSKVIPGNYQLITEKVVFKYNPRYSNYNEEKAMYNYSKYIKPLEKPKEFKVNVKEEIKRQGGC